MVVGDGVRVIVGVRVGVAVREGVMVGVLVRAGDGVLDAVGVVEGITGISVLGVGVLVGIVVCVGANVGVTVGVAVGVSTMSNVPPPTTKSNTAVAAKPINTLQLNPRADGLGAWRMSPRA